MKRSTERILTTHVGSLTRPLEIIDAMRARVNSQPYNEEKLCGELAASGVRGRRAAGGNWN